MIVKNPELSLLASEGYIWAYTALKRWRHKLQQTFYNIGYLSQKSDSNVFRQDNFFGMCWGDRKAH